MDIWKAFIWNVGNVSLMRFCKEMFVVSVHRHPVGVVHPHINLLLLHGHPPHIPDVSAGAHPPPPAPLLLLLLLHGTPQLQSIIQLHLQLHLVPRQTGWPRRHHQPAPPQRGFLPGSGLQAGLLAATCRDHLQHLVHIRGVHQVILLPRQEGVPQGWNQLARHCRHHLLLHRKGYYFFNTLFISSPKTCIM